MTKYRTTFTAFLLLLTASLWGCSGGAPGESGSDSSVLANVGEETITADDFIERLRIEDFDLLRGTIDAMAAEMVVKKEAEARGIDIDELFRLEVSAKISLPNPQEIQQFYEASKDSPTVQGRSLEEMRSRIAQFLQQQKAIDRRNAYVAELKRAAGVHVMVQPERADLTIPAGTPTRGPADAPITIVEFADFQCPSCRRAYADVERILSEYSNQIQYVFLDFPLTIHPRAVPASEASHCAADQDKYWDYHQSLMLFASPLSDADLLKRATDMGMDGAAFDACYKARNHSGILQSSSKMGRELGVSSTPTFFINGRKIVGAPPYESFREIIEEELARLVEG